MHSVVRKSEWWKDAEIALTFTPKGRRKLGRK
jgi:hypothetical protein